MSIEWELACDGVLPSGPVSGWPRDRHEALMAKAMEYSKGMSIEEATPTHSEYSPSFAKMAKGVMRTASQAARYGRASEEVRTERYETCKACPAFNPKSKRCKDCGCFMEAKTWVGGNPDTLCPRKKWRR